MERKIQNIFFDQNNNIYVVDDFGLLYWYHEDHFFPFLALMDDIKNCFMIGYTIFVYHNTTISQFDLSMSPIINEEPWITKNVDDVCYHKDLNIIVTLEQGEIYVNFNASILENEVLINDTNEYINTVNRVSLSHKWKYVNDKLYLSEYHKFEKIKIVDDFLMVYSDNKINIFYLQMNEFEPLTHITAKQDIFDNISEINPVYNIFQMKDGSIISTDKLLCTHAHLFACLNDPIYQKQKIYLLLKDGYLLCYYENSKYTNIIEPLLKILPNDFFNTMPISDNQNFTTIKLLKDKKIFVINNSLSQLIYCDGKVYLVNDNLFKEILLDPDLISYDHLNSYLKHNTKNDLVIDIDISKSVFHQLVNIVPYIYRLNHDKSYCFEQIDQLSNVVSYGVGVTRNTFTLLAKEFDEYFKNNFMLFKLDDAFNIGKLLFFCVWEGNEKFFNIPPYFVYNLTNECDNILLLKKFKGNDFNLYYGQYLKYYANPKELVDLELGLEDYNDYIKYLLTDNLSQDQIAFYDLMAEGFHFFAVRNKLNTLLEKLPVTYYTNLLIADGYFSAIIDFLVENDQVNNYYFEQFKRIFTKLFSKLENKEMATFCQNVTGSQYYSGEISIILAYDKENIYSKYMLDNETIILDENNRPIEIENAIVNMNLDDSDEKNLVYKISTCNAELIIYVVPTMENLTSILNALIIDDPTMKN